MKLILVLSLFLSFNVLASVKFSSPYVQKINFTIDDGIVISDGLESPELVVRNQLKYMFGILNEVDSGVDFPQMKISVASTVGGEIHYNVSGVIAWDKKRTFPRSFNFSLPKWGDIGGRTEFLNKYQKNCAKKPSSLESFWNYYRPHHTGCVIDGQDIVQVVAQFSPDVASDESLAPNYPEIFKDDRLEMTVIMTKEQPLDINDASIYDFQNFCGKQEKKECHIESFQNGIRIAIHAFLLDNFDQEPQIFLSRIQNYLANSDVVTYNGHSGMGANIESWMKYYPVKDKEKYQIFFFNSCDTFGYLRNDFLLEGNRHVILNATPNYFGTFNNSNRSIIEEILMNADFNQILLSLPLEQHSLLLYGIKFK